MKKALATLFSFLFLAFVFNLRGNIPARPFGLPPIPDVQVPFPVSTGNLDATFSTAGIVATAIGTVNDVAQAVAIQADGKIVVAGYSFNGSYDHFALVRYNPNGSRDNTFGVDGVVLTQVGPTYDQAYALAIQSDGKIVAVGYAGNGLNADVAVVRYNIDGSLDTTFDGDGRVMIDVAQGNDQGRSVAIQPDGKIVVAGYAFNGSNSDIVLIRLEANGSRDYSFNGNSGFGYGVIQTRVGTASDTVTSVAIQPDGRIIVSGFYPGPVSTDSFVVRYKTDGVLDTTFSGDGIATFAFSPSDVDEALAMALQPDGKIVITGCIRGNGRLNDYLIARIQPDGNLDQNFGTGGFTFVPFSLAPDISYGVGVQADGKIVAVGFAYNGANNDFGVTRVNADGTLDTSFGIDGRRLIAFGSSTDFANALAIQADGKIVIAGRAVVGSTNVFATARLGYGTNAEGNDGFFNLDQSTAIRFDNAFLRGTSSVGLVEVNGTPSLMPGWFFVGAPKVVQTTAQFSGNNLVRLTMPADMDQASFDAVRVLQPQNGVWIDRTAVSPLRDYAAKSIYASISSLGILAAALPGSTALVTVSGRVTTPSGVGLRNVFVSLIDANNVRRTASTSSFGNFVFSDVVSGQTYTLAVASRQYRFAPKTMSVTSNVTNVDFVGLE